MASLDAHFPLQRGGFPLPQVIHGVYIYVNGVIVIVPKDRLYSFTYQGGGDDGFSRASYLQTQRITILCRKNLSTATTFLPRRLRMLLTRCM